MQASTESMPQSASPAVAETNTGTKQEKGGFMYSWKDRLIDWANTKGAWTHILLAVGIALFITTIILAAAMPSKGAVRANAVDIGELQTTTSTISGQLSAKASQADLDNWLQDINATLGIQAGDTNSIGNRISDVEAKVEAKLDAIEGCIVAINNSLAELTCSPLEAYLTGAFGDYALHAISGEAGNFTANVHLVYPAPVYVGNTTSYDETVSAFYAGINFAELPPTYIPTITFNGTAWGISEVWWNIGTFELAVNTEKAISITCAGLNIAWKPSFAYVEVWPISKEGHGG